MLASENRVVNVNADDSVMVMPPGFRKSWLAKCMELFRIRSEGKTFASLQI
jgi:hypothetical protein